jgi:hypothetical protein
MDNVQLTLTSPKSGSHLVGIVRLRAQAMEYFFLDRSLQNHPFLNKKSV